MSLLTDEIKLKKVELTKELFDKYKPELLDMMVSQYHRKDPSSVCSSYDILLKYFEEEYEAVFTTDKSYKVGFLYFDEEGALVGNFMMRDAYITGINHAKALETMKPTDDFYDYDLVLIKHLNEIWAKYNIRDGEAIYGTNLAFCEKFLAKFKGKAVLNLIFAMFADLSVFWAEKLPDFKYGIWVQMRKSLYSTTMKVFNVLEGREFVFLDDKGAKMEGKLFLVSRKDYAEVVKLWEPMN